MGKHREREPGRESEVLGGVVVQFNFSPRGGVEGLLLRDGDRTTQVNVPPEAWPLIADAVALGREARVSPCRSRNPPRQGRGHHPVYRLAALQPAGEADEEDRATVEGVVERLNYAGHGEPNGVVPRPATSST